MKHTTQTDITRLGTIQRQTIYSIIANLGLAIAKLVFGVLGKSSALIADGMHSFSDLLTDALVLISAKAAAKKADHDHPYGHKRIETASSQLIAWILIVVGVLFAWEIINAWLHGQTDHPHTIVWIVALISTLTNEILYRVMARAANKVNSKLLLSNALHHRADGWTSLIVVVGTLLSIYTPWHLDALAALIIAALIIKMGVKLAWDSMQELIDKAADDKTLQQIRSAILKTVGVNSIHQLRTRLYAGDIYIDVHILVNPFISVSEGHHVGERVEENILKNVKDATDITVHIDPEDDEICAPCAHLPAREEITNQFNCTCSELSHYSEIDNIVIHYKNGKIILDMYFKSQKIKHSDKLKQEYLENIQSKISQCSKINFFIISNSH
jgi:cation diffusion facilitator family transporter